MKIQLILKLHGFELHVSTYMQIYLLFLNILSFTYYSLNNIFSSLPYYKNTVYNKMFMLLTGFQSAVCH